MKKLTKRVAPALLVFVLVFGALWSCAVPAERPAQQSRNEYFLIVLVSAVHLDYTNTETLVRSLYKQKWKQNGFVGHSWIFLKGQKEGRPFTLEVGLSQPADQADMFRGVLDLNDYGYVDPTGEQKLNPRFEPNPVRRLWDDWNTGVRLAGRQGRTYPTYAALVHIDKDVFERILAYADPANYDFKSFSLAGRQCTTFAAGAAALAGLEVETEIPIKVPRTVEFGGRTVRLWEDPKYSVLVVSSPDKLEESLIQAVRQGRAEYGLDVYKSLR